MNESISAVPSLTAKAQKLRERLIFERFPNGRAPFDPYVHLKKARIEDMAAIFNAVIIAEGGPIIKIARTWKGTPDIEIAAYHRTESCLQELVGLGVVERKKVGRYHQYFARGASE